MKMSFLEYLVYFGTHLGAVMAAFQACLGDALENKEDELPTLVELL